MEKNKKISSGEKRVLLLAGGRSVRILGESGKYWICEGTQFRKNNPAVLGVAPAIPGARAKLEKAAKKRTEDAEAPEGGCSGDSCPVSWPEDGAEPAEAPEDGCSGEKT